MRILHVNLGFAASPVDGIGAVVATLVAAQREAGHTVTRLDSRWRARHRQPAAALHAFRAVARTRSDIVHLHSVYRPLHAIVVTACVMTATPFALSPHSGLAPAGRARRRRSKTAWIALVEKPILRRAAVVICLSSLEEDDIRALVPRARTAVVRNPVALPAPYSRPSDDARGERCAVTLARFDVYQKGLDRLVDLARTMPEVRFDVYGEPDGNDAHAARALIAQAPSNTRFLPPVLGMRKQRVLAAADVYIQLSRWEGQSIALFEAMAVGTPCIVSEYVAGTLGPVGRELVVPVPEGADAAAAAVRMVLADPERRSRMGAAAAEWARATTDPASVVRDLENVYAGAIAAARSSTPVHRGAAERPARMDPEE